MTAKRQSSSSEATPADLFDPANFPDDLQWIVAQHRLHPADPALLLLAWHWRRMQQSEDVLAAAQLRLQTLLDGRTQALSEAAETVFEVNESLAGVQAALEEKPAELTAQIDTMLAQPITAALARIGELEKRLAGAAKSFHVSQRRQLLAVLMTGVALGALSMLIVTGR